MPHDGIGNVKALQIHIDDIDGQEVKQLTHEFCAAYFAQIFDDAASARHRHQNERDCKQANSEQSKFNVFHGNPILAVKMGGQIFICRPFVFVGSPV
jgi:hypothetical protein